MDLLNVFLSEILPGATAGAAIVWLFRNWISERLKQSIAHEYSAKLENIKNEFNQKLEMVKHDYEVHQLRTSLFFDHQRAAFAEILAKIAELNREWWKGYTPETGLIKAAPFNEYEQLKILYFNHQLFLDADSVMAMELLFEIYGDSFPFVEDPGAEPIYRDPQGPYDNAEYIRPKLAALFQQKIGVATNTHALRQLAILGSVRILNRYHFAEIELPVRGNLKLDAYDGAADTVSKGEKNFDTLVEKVREFQEHLRLKPGLFHEAEAQLNRYLAILNRKSISEN